MEQEASFELDIAEEPTSKRRGTVQEKEDMKVAKSTEGSLNQATKRKMKPSQEIGNTAHIVAEEKKVEKVVEKAHHKKKENHQISSSLF